MQNAEALASELGDQRRLSWIAYGIAHCHYLANDQARTVEAGQRALALGGARISRTKSASTCCWATPSTCRGTIARRRSSCDGTSSSSVSASGAIRPADLSHLSRRYQPERLARCLGELGEFAEALRVGDDGLRIAEEINHAPSLTGMCLGLGLLHMRHNDLDRALAVLERGLDVGRRGNIYL